MKLSAQTVGSALLEVVQPAARSGGTGKAASVVGDPEKEAGILARPRPGHRARDASACCATFERTSRSTGSKCSATLSETSESTRPSKRSSGAKPSDSRAESTWAKMSTRRPRSRGACNREDRVANLADRLVELAGDVSDTLVEVSAGPSDGSMVCSSNPVANRRWITLSWRSRAMRPRSSSTASCSTRSTSRALSTAMPAADASATARCSSTS